MIVQFTKSILTLAVTLSCLSPVHAEDNAPSLQQEIKSIKKQLAENDQHLQILNAQVDIYLKYLDTKGESLFIKLERSTPNGIPQEIYLLGTGAGLALTAAGTTGMFYKVQSSKGLIKFLYALNAKRLLRVGLITTATSAVLWGFDLYLKSDENLARKDMIDFLDKQPLAETREQMKSLVQNDINNITQEQLILTEQLQRLEEKVGPHAPPRPGVVR